MGWGGEREDWGEQLLSSCEFAGVCACSRHPTLPLPRNKVLHSVLVAHLRYPLLLSLRRRPPPSVAARPEPPLSSQTRISSGAIAPPPSSSLELNASLLLHVWDSYPKTDSDNLERSQRNAARLEPSQQHCTRHSPRQLGEQFTNSHCSQSSKSTVHCAILHRCLCQCEKRAQAIHTPHTHTHARTHTRTHARTHEHTHARTHIHRHTHTHFPVWWCRAECPQMSG